MIIGVDIDGVLANSAPVYCEAMQELFGKTFNPEDILEYDLLKSFGINESEFEQFMNHLKNTGKWMKIEPFEYAREFIDHLMSLHEVIIVTSRPKDLKEVTISWLIEHQIGFHDILFDCQGGEKFERAVDKGYFFSYFIDDCYDILKYFAEKNVQGIMMEAPWNASLPLPTMIFKAKTLKVAENYILKIGTKK